MIYDIPWELESEILSRVPTKSLVKWKTACKRWYTLFKDQKFIKKNLGTAAREVILLKNFKVYSIKVNLHGIHNSVEPSMEFTGELRSLKDPIFLKVFEIFHCDGLILCALGRNTRLVVWNPCTGETRWIKPRTCYKDCDIYALGYGNNNSSCHSYKILRSCLYYDEKNLRVSEFEIYDFSSSSWRVLDDVPGSWSTFSLGVSLKGNCYWIAFDKETGFFLLKFDFTTDKFGRLPLPFQSHDHEDMVVLSVVKEEQLAVLCQKLHTFSLVMKIWVTNNSKIDEAKDMSWRNFLVVDFGKFELPRVMSVVSFMLDEEKKVAVCCDTDMIDEDKTRIYIVGEELHKEVYKENTKGSMFNWPLLRSYVPSLVNIEKNAGKGKKKMKQNEVRIGGQRSK